MRDKPWGVIDLLDNTKATCMHATEIEALQHHQGQAVTIRYMPGRKAKVVKKEENNAGS